MSGRKAAWCGLALALLTLAAFSGVARNAFVGLDDDRYILSNGGVASGLSPGAALWALTSFREANWHPLTWLSHQMDVTLFGFKPAGHHLHSLLLHAGTVVGLFAVWLAMTGATLPAFLLAALFAVHPLHVESVAWAAERKDVLSGLLFVLSLAAYLRWLRRPSAARYAVLLLFAALGLASKPMLVTLPGVLLVMDWWPLGRLSGPPAGKRSGERPARLLAEKLPLVALSAASSAVTVIAQKGAGALDPLADVPFGARAANAAISYVSYLGKTVWPAALSVFYPFPESVSMRRALAAGLLLAVLTAAAALLRRRRPCFAAAWLLYVGMLLPVIGFFKVGGQAMADRYMYLPMIGPGLAAGCGTLAAWRRPRFRPAVAAAWAAVLLLLTARTVEQTGRWRDSVTLYRHSLAVTPGNWFVEANLGFELYRLGREEEAYRHLTAALETNPAFPPAWLNLGVLLANRGRIGPAIDCFSRALEHQPAFPLAQLNLGMALEDAGRHGEALAHFREAVRLDPGNAAARSSLLRAERRQAGSVR